MIVKQIFLSMVIFCLAKECIYAKTDSKTLEEFYDFWAPNYKKFIENAEYKIYELINEKKSFLPEKAQLVLDLGCADGTVGEIVGKDHTNYTFIGVDISAKMLKCCAQKIMYSHVVKADLSDGFPQKISNKTYDLVFAMGCLEFIQNHEVLFDMIQKSLKTGGQFWLTLQVDNDNAGPILNKIHKSDTILNVYSKEQAQNILKRHNFNILTIEKKDDVYKNSETKKYASYFMIIAEKK